MASAVELGEQLDDVKLNAVYAGCRLLTPVAEFLQVPIDQVNFLTCHTLALLAAYPFRHIFHPSRTSLNARHSIEVLLGIFLAAFCFGKHCLHLFVESTACYILIKFGPRRLVHINVFVVAMIYLAGSHLFRQLYNYGSYTLDITAPLMVMTQKLTSLAFSLHDGTQKDISSLSQDQKKHMLSREPTALEFYSYMFYFHGFLCGPLSFYNDYIAFIDGSNFTQALKDRPAKKNEQNGLSSGEPAPCEPLDAEMQERSLISNHVARKLAVAFVCGVLILAFPNISPRRMTDAAFFELSFPRRILMVYACMAITRQRYYLAWTLAEAVNHNAGLGFRGFDENGDDKWDLNENVHILKVEFATSLKEVIDNWNVTTSVWLRRIVYERIPYQKMLATFTVSVFWHGFYPGYYITFFTAAFFTLVARKVRHLIRPYFQSTAVMSRSYDVFTMVVTCFALHYMTAPFSLLRFNASINLLSSIYWYAHILSVMLLVVLYGYQAVRRTPKPTNKTVNDQPK